MESSDRIIKIKWLYDDHDCETCGSSYAEGAVININGKEIELEPLAHCFGGTTYDERKVFETILKELGYTVEYSE
jgi:hypothetical protein